MAIININLDLNENYKDFLQDAYKIIVILFVIQIIFHAMQPDKDFLMKALNGDILNDNLLILIIIILIGISSYYLVFNELLELN